MLPIFLLSVLTFVSSVVNAQSVVWDNHVQGSNTFASPRVVDLNGDGVADVVVGCGRELADTSDGVFAFDGVTGEILWSTEARSQIFGSPIFHDITGDGTPEVFIGGRRSQFYCIDGSSGDILWEAVPCSQLLDCFTDSLPNFYTGQWLEDLSGDGIPEIVNVLGGFAPAEAGDPDRPPGHVVIIDGATGEMLRQYETPDGSESYNSPIVWKVDGQSPMVVFGSGGETISGSLWAASVASLWSGQPEFIELVSSELKGFMAPASIADMDGDGLADIVAMSFDGRVTVVSGADVSVIWSERHFPGNESSTVPCLLYFDGDDVPDVAVNYSTGVFPSYTGGFHCVLSGLDGSVLWQSGQSVFPFHSAVAFRAEGEGSDRLVLVRNQAGGQNQVALSMVTSDGSQEQVIAEQGSINLASTPFLHDFDGDGLLDVIFITTTHGTNPFSEDNMRVRRLSTGIALDDIGIVWGGYMGTGGDGIMHGHVSDPVSAEVALDGNRNLLAMPNPFADRIAVQGLPGGGVYSLHDMAGRSISTGVFHGEIELAPFPVSPGPYILEVVGQDGVSARFKMFRSN
jgi:outer membrane protein assembly factor BamB